MAIPAKGEGVYKSILGARCYMQEKFSQIIQLWLPDAAWTLAALNGLWIQSIQTMYLTVFHNCEKNRTSTGLQVDLEPRVCSYLFPVLCQKQRQGE